MKQISIVDLQTMKDEAIKIATLTSYDASFTKAAEKAGIDMLLVGDSLGMVIQGHESTLPVTIDEMIYHSRAVARARKRCLLVVDMPFMSYTTPDIALKNAGRLMKEGGAHMVKLEGGASQVDKIKVLTENALPVCAHLGLQPQSYYKLGGYKVQGRSKGDAKRIKRDALLVEAAGAQLLVLECVPASLGKEISQALKIPVIGIGAGADCDGQILVLHDLLGMAEHPARFVADFLIGTGSIVQAIESYVNAVKTGDYPALEHTFA